MSGVDDNVAVIGDWLPPSPSPRTFFSALLGDDIGTKPLENNKSEGLFLGAPDRLNLTTEQRSNSRGGLGERIAARTGFNALRLNTEGMRSTDLSENPEVRSLYLTIPPGLSPTTLLDSPVFLSNSLVQPSPTTGKFPFFPNNADKGSGLLPSASDATKKSQFKGNGSSSFAFKPLVDSGGSSFFGSGSNVQPQNDSVYHALTEYSRPLITNGPDRSPPLDDQGNEEGDPRGGAGDPMVGVGDGPAEDGYNWRKYGQKQVKGSKYPRSYYKCTHTNCPVKKKVERSHEGHIIEIIYQGVHKHPKPLPNRRSVIGGPDVLGNMPPEMLGGDGDPAWANMCKAVTAEAANWRQDNNHDGTSSPSDGPEVVGNPALSLSLPARNRTRFESADQVDRSSTFSNDEGEDGQQTHASVSMGYDGDGDGDGDGDESESKRRKIEAYASDVSGATRAIHETRVVVQTTSEVDILDDGYRWRKYGQKVVKGNPNPRSYYKCTSAGCTVRKHVERASHDLKSVITTYEGKHNHDVPAARNSSHANSGVIPAQSTATGVQNQVNMLEPSQVQSMMARFDGPTSLCPINLPSRRAPGLGPSQGFSFRMSQMGLANLGMAGEGPGQGKLPMMQVHLHPFLMQQRPANEMGIMLPKGEAKVEPGSEPGLNLSNSSAATLYQQMMNRLPLGHQM